MERDDEEVVAVAGGGCGGRKRECVGAYVCVACVLCVCVCVMQSGWPKGRVR